MKGERVYDHFCQVVFLIILLVSGFFFFQSLDDNFFFRCFSRWSTPFFMLRLTTQSEIFLVLLFVSNCTFWPSFAFFHWDA